MSLTAAYTVLFVTTSADIGAYLYLADQVLLTCMVGPFIVLGAVRHDSMYWQGLYDWGTPASEPSRSTRAGDSDEGDEGDTTDDLGDGGLGGAPADDRQSNSQSPSQSQP